jgi:leader peptidase (prepilin peptidase)/N-methyltransferase
MSWLVLPSIGLFSLLIGGFLAVIIYRLPLILKNQSNGIVLAKPFNIVVPSSHCPECHHALHFLERLPLFAYLFLKGKCAYCQKKIHPRYLLIETITLIGSSVIIYRFDLNLHMLAALILTWGLITLGGIDFEQSILPDVLVLPLLWLGLILNVFHVFASPASAILGASVAYLSLWVVAKSYGYLVNKEAMGHGDFKCFALLGAWLGIYALIDILIIASLLGLVAGSILWIREKSCFQKSIPFGPYLALAGWLVLIFNTAH